MTNEEYKKIVDNHIPKVNKSRNAAVAFLAGGCLGLFSEALSFFITLTFNIDKEVSYLIVCLMVVFLTSLFTSLGFFDNWVIKWKCGLIIPTTGFAHSVTSAALEYKKDGMITGIGANVFKLAGSVILYGIVSAFLLCFIRVII